MQTNVFRFRYGSVECVSGFVGLVEMVITFGDLVNYVFQSYPDDSMIGIFRISPVYPLDLELRRFCIHLILIIAYDHQLCF